MKKFLCSILFCFVLNTPTPAVLVAAYSFDEGIGTTLSDSSGNNNIGTIVGATWATGHSLGALAFNGSSNMVTIQDSVSLQLPNAITLEAWVNPDVSSGWRTVLMKERTSNLCYVLYSSSNSNLPWAEITSGGVVRNATGGSVLPINTWSHIAMTYDGANIKLFINGVQAAQTATTGTVYSSTNPLRIGGNVQWSEWFDGLIDDVRVYDTALTTAQIITDMNTPVTLVVPEPPTGYATGQWEWDAVIGTDTNGDGIPDSGIPTGYRIYYTTPSCCSDGICLWPITQIVNIPADTQHCGVTNCSVASACCGDFPAEPPESVVFFVITAYNGAGESSTEHGTIIATPCP